MPRFRASLFTLVLAALVSVPLSSPSRAAVTAPTAMRGYWFFVLFDADNRPQRDLLVFMRPNGEIAYAGAYKSLAALPSPEEYAVVGQLLDPAGRFALLIGQSSPPLLISGQLGTNNEAAGEWQQGATQGTVRGWRAGGSVTFTHILRLSSPDTNLKLLSGLLRVNSDRLVMGHLLSPKEAAPWFMRGVITATANLIAVVRIPAGDGGEMGLLLNGQVSAAGGSGSWTLGGTFRPGSWNAKPRPTLPDGMPGIWALLARDGTGHPYGGVLLEVTPDAEIRLPALASVGGPSLCALAPKTVLGYVADTSGYFVATLGGSPSAMLISGRVRLDDRGEGVWHQPSRRGSLELRRASGAPAFTLPQVGVHDAQQNDYARGHFNIDAQRLVWGYVDKGGVLFPIRGVVTGADEIVAWTEVGQPPRPHFFLGRITRAGKRSFGGTGVWQAADGAQGRWLALAVTSLPEPGPLSPAR